MPGMSEAIHGKTERALADITALSLTVQSLTTTAVQALMINSIMSQHSKEITILTAFPMFTIMTMTMTALGTIGNSRQSDNPAL
ncbi:MAG: hypothetical protein ACYSSI_10365 [Planctomycetota bacterium]